MTVDVSVLLELENARFTAGAWIEVVVDAVAGEIERAVARGLRIELVVLYNEQRSTEPERMAVLDRLRRRGVGEVRAIGHPTALYYELKNIGAEAARGETLVGIDSDVRPEPGWLEALLRAHAEHPQIPYLLGHTYFRVTDAFSRGYALGAHYFPLREQGVPGVGRSAGLWANNFVCSRELLRVEPFGITPCEVARGGCFDFDRRLRRRGFVPHVVHAAKAEHFLADTADLRRQEGVKLGATNFFVRTVMSQGFRATYLASLCQMVGVLLVRTLLAAPRRARALGVSLADRPRVTARVLPVLARALLTELRLRWSPRFRGAHGF